MSNTVIPEKVNAATFLEEIRRVTGHDWRVIYEDFSHEIFLYTGQKTLQPRAWVCAIGTMDPEQAGDFFRRLGELMARKMTESSQEEVSDLRDVQSIKTAEYTGVRVDPVKLTAKEFLSTLEAAPDDNFRTAWNIGEGKLFLYIGEGTLRLEAYESPRNTTIGAKAFDDLMIMASKIVEQKQRVKRKLAEKSVPETTRLDGMGLTPAEHKALRLTVEIAELFATEIVGLGRSSKQDRREAAAKIHDLQRMIMAQAAARAHPDLYRLLGKGGDWLSAR